MKYFLTALILHFSSMGHCICMVKHGVSSLVVQGVRFVKFDTIKTDCNIKLTTYSVIDKDSVVEEGLIYRGKYIPCQISVQGNEYSIKIGKKGINVRPSRKLICSEGAQQKIFNNKRNGKRVGIWLRFYPWGKIRKALLYKDGGPTVVLIYRPNGFVIRHYYYSNLPSGFMYKIRYDKDGKEYPGNRGLF